MKTLADDVQTPAEKHVALRDALSETRAVLKRASELWAGHSCPGTAECCQLQTTQRFPWLWPTEWKVLQERLKRDHRPIPPERPDGGCPLLDAAGKRCTVYEDRPYGCRTFFCHRITGAAKQPLFDTLTLLDRLAALNIALDPQAEAIALPDLLRDFGEQPAKRT